jgi:hypothetical protein
VVGADVEAGWAAQVQLRELCEPAGLLKLLWLYDCQFAVVQQQ